MTLPLADIPAPVIDYKALSPLMALIGGSIVVLMVGLLRSRVVRHEVVPALTAITLFTAIGLTLRTFRYSRALGPQLEQPAPPDGGQS